MTDVPSILGNLRKHDTYRPEPVKPPTWKDHAIKIAVWGGGLVLALLVFWGIGALIIDWSSIVEWFQSFPPAVFEVLRRVLLGAGVVLGVLLALFVLLCLPN